MDVYSTHCIFLFFAVYNSDSDIFPKFFAVDLISNFEKSSFKYDSKIDEFVRVINIIESKFFLGICR